MAITERRFHDRAPWAALEVVKWSPDRATWIPPHASKPRFRSAVIFPRRISLYRYRFVSVASLSLLSVAHSRLNTRSDRRVQDARIPVANEEWLSFFSLPHMYSPLSDTY